MEGSFKAAVWEVVKTALLIAAFCLFAMALLAVVVRAYAPTQTVITIANWAIKSVGTFVFCMLFIKRERALFKGLAAGLTACVLTMLLFAAIGGGFSLDLLFLPELLLLALLGAGGALLGTKLRKE